MLSEGWNVPFGSLHSDRTAVESFFVSWNRGVVGSFLLLRHIELLVENATAGNMVLNQ